VVNKAWFSVCLDLVFLEQLIECHVCRVIRIAIPNHFQFLSPKNVEDKLCTHTLWQKKNKSSAGSVLPDFKLTLVYIFFFLKFLKVNLIQT
jgi:hypothetical protein